MWPLKLDMSKDECRGALRRLELDAYSSVVSTFRAQGSLDSGKQNVLEQLRRCFHICSDRHKAEVRRVANCEKLTTISELLNGRSYDLEWIREGHRNYPLIGRATPYSALHILADHASKAAAIENSDLPDPADTRRLRTFDDELTGKPIVTEDPTLPPPSPANFGISRKDLKKSFDLSALHQSARKKHYQHLKPPPPPNVKIQHLYQTLHTKRPRKSLTKKSSKSRSAKQSSGRLHLPYPPDHFEGAELQKHLTSQLMPPPMNPMKSPHAPILPANRREVHMISGNSLGYQHLEPHAHYIPNNAARLKSELMGETTKGRPGRTKNVNSQHRNNYQQQKYANGAGARNLDHIPDPQIIFNTTSSSKKMEQAMDSLQREHNKHEIDMSPQAMASPLQLLSTAASCTPKLKITSPVHHQQPSTSQPTTTMQGGVKTVQSRAIKIVPANNKPMLIKPSDAMKSAQTIVTAPSSKFKIQKIQLVMNKSQDGTSTTASLSPSATIVSGKAGQLVLSGKGITNSFHVGGKPPYTIVSAPKIGPKVIVQQIDRSSDSTIPENQRITENTPIDFLPSTTGTTNFPKVIIQKATAAVSKQIKFKLGPSLVNPKIVKGPIPANVKIQRNINMKGFTVLNSSQIVQLQSQAATAQAALPTTSSSSGEGSKVDWEQELDDANRTSTGKSGTRSNGERSDAKRMRLDEAADESLQEICYVESEAIEASADQTSLAFENQPQIEIIQEEQQLSKDSDVVSEFVFLNSKEEAEPKPVEEVTAVASMNGEELAEANGEVEDERQTQNGAEAYENLVKSLTECDTDYMKEIDEPQMDENFGLTMIDENFTFTRESGLFQ